MAASAAQPVCVISVVAPGCHCGEGSIADHTTEQMTVCFGDDVCGWCEQSSWPDHTTAERARCVEERYAAQKGRMRSRKGGWKPGDLFDLSPIHPPHIQLSLADAGAEGERR